MEKQNRKNRLEKICSACGEKLDIRRTATGGFAGGHYFGIIDAPVDYEISGRWEDIFEEPDIVNIILWKGEKRKAEYWECDRCYKN